MTIKVLHIVGGPSHNGAFKGAYILHKALLELKVESKILNDVPMVKKNEKSDENVIQFNNTYLKKNISKILVYLEKIMKSIYLPIPRSTYTLGLFGYDITKFEEYKKSDIIHIHWLSEGFINLRTLMKTNKPIIWTMRDMWPFTGGSHYTMDFEDFEKSFISKIIQKIKRRSYKKNIKFVAISDWLKDKAVRSKVLKDKEIIRIYNNINLRDFKVIEKNLARSNLNINTNKQIILYGAHNPQNTRKGWNIFLETLKKLDKTKYYLLIFGNFWSQNLLDDIGIEYKNLGFIDDKKKLNLVYSSADFFVFSSIQEAFGKTWAEALACHTPVICFSNTSASEFVEHKSNGYICDGFNDEKLKEGINWLSNKMNYNNLKNNTVNKKLFEIDAQNIAKKYIEIYLDSIKNQNKL